MGKCICIIYFCLSLVYPTIAQAISRSSSRLAVSILYFDFDEATDKDLRWVKWGIPDLLYTKFSRSRQLRLVERDRMKSLVDEIALGLSGLINDEDAAKAGNIVGAQFNVYGRVIKIGRDHVVITGKISEISTGEVFAEKVEGKKNDILRLIDSLAEKLLNKLAQIAVLKTEIESEPEVISALGYTTRSLAATAHFYQALDYVDNQNFRLAIQEYKEAIKLDPSFARAYVNLGAVYLQMDRFDLAVENIHSALEIFPNSELAHFNMGLVYGHLKDFDKGIAEFRKALDINSNNEEYYVELGKAYYKKKDYYHATEAYKQALSLNEKYVPAHYYLGVIYRRQNRLDEAITEWHQAILTNEPYFKAIKQLAYKQIGDLYFFIKVYDSAIQNYRKALEISIEGEIRGETLLGLGKSYLKTQHPQEALQPLEQALNYIPDSPDLRLSYGYALLGVKENDRAMAEFQTTIRIDTDGPYGNIAKEILRDLRGH